MASSLVLMGGCSLIYDDLPECPSQLRLRFVYDYNMKYADAFSHEVKSVNVWAFDSNGVFVWSGNQTGAVLQQKDFVMDTNLPEGKYDFVAWCGLEDNDAFSLSTYTPSSREELEVKLKTMIDKGQNISDSRLNSIYNGVLENVEYMIDPQKPSLKTATVYLMKMTNNITVMLQNIDGTAIKEGDFTASLSCADAWLEWNGNVASDSPLVTYKPWRQLFGEASLDKDGGKSQLTSVSALIFGLSTSRLMAQGETILTITRTSDNKEIIKIPLVEYLLLEKEMNHESLSDQEYLDRRDDYSVLFFIDGNSNWFISAGIYINGWAVVPSQSDSI